MKKTTIGKLIFTTIMIPGISLANEDMHGTPISKEFKQKREKVLADFPSTPELKAQVASKYDGGILSPDTRDAFVEMGVARARSERNESKARRILELDESEAEVRLKLTKEKEEKRRAQERAAQEELIEKAKAAITEKQKENLLLEEKVSELSVGIAQLQGRLNNANELRKYSVQQVQDMALELELKRQALAETRQQLQKAKHEVEGLKMQVDTEREGNERLAQGIRDIAISKNGPSSGTAELVAPVVNFAPTGVGVVQNPAPKKVLPGADLGGKKGERGK